jgi:ABC-2 type transport system ATP-binding protein
MMNYSADPLVIEGLSKSYGHVQAVKNVSFSVPAGSVFAFLGENGAGKTTTIKAALGLLRPDAGRIAIFGRDPFADWPAIAPRVGYVPESRALYDTYTVSRTLSLTASFYPWWDHAYVRELVARFGLPLDRKVRDLSKGMRAQLSLVLALGHRPALLILDEPTEGMDPLVRHDFLTTIVAEIIAEDRAILISSHVLSEVERIATHLCLIHQGTVALSGALENIRAREWKAVARFRAPVRSQQASSLPGVIAIGKEDRDGLVWGFEGSGDIVAFREAARALGLENLDVQPLALEELFIRYVRGSVSPANRVEGAEANGFRPRGTGGTPDGAYPRGHPTGEGSHRDHRETDLETDRDDSGESKSQHDDEGYSIERRVSSEADSDEPGTKASGEDDAR